MCNDENNIECAAHGERSTAFICHHLHEGRSLGFHMGFDPDNPDVLYPDAWCDKCDEVLEQEGEWNDTSEAFANIKLVCSECYRQIREKNWKQDEQSFADLIESSIDYFHEVQGHFVEEFKVGNHERWDWYQETGKLVFSHGGEPVLECNIDFAGTFSTTSNTWMWAWANTSFTENIKEKSRLIREMGEQNHYMKLACAHWSADETDGWEMTAVMAKAIGAMGVYRTPSDNGFVYMVIDNAAWVKQRNSNNILSFPNKKK